MAVAAVQTCQFDGVIQIRVEMTRQVSDFGRLSAVAAEADRRCSGLGPAIAVGHRVVAQVDLKDEIDISNYSFKHGSFMFAGFFN